MAKTANGGHVVVFVAHSHTHTHKLTNNLKSIKTNNNIIERKKITTKCRVGGIIYFRYPESEPGTEEVVFDLARGAGVGEDLPLLCVKDSFRDDFQLINTQ